MQKRSPVGSGPSRKNVPEMRLASRAQHFRAAHEVAVVLARNDRIPGDRRVEAGPPRSGIVFRIGIEQRRIAALAPVDARRLGIPIDAAERRLRAGPAGDVKFQPRQLRLPFLIRLCYLGHVGCPVVVPRERGAAVAANDDYRTPGLHHESIGPAPDFPLWSAAVNLCGRAPRALPVR